MSVIRAAGNAGHTVAVDGVEYKLRLMPSGILYKGTLCVVGNGVAFNPKVMLQEMDGMIAQGIDVSGIRISNRAHVVLPYHCEMDGYIEELKGDNKLVLPRMVLAHAMQIVITVLVSVSVILLTRKSSPSA